MMRCGGMDLRSQIMSSQPEEQIWALKVQLLMSKHPQQQTMVVVERCSLEADPTSVLFIRAVKGFLPGMRLLSAWSL